LKIYFVDFRFAGISLQYSNRLFMKILRFFIISAIAIIAVSWFTQTDTWKKTKALHLPKKEISY